MLAARSSPCSEPLLLSPAAVSQPRTNSGACDHTCRGVDGSYRCGGKKQHLRLAWGATAWWSGAVCINFNYRPHSDR